LTKLTPHQETLGQAELATIFRALQFSARKHVVHRRKGGRDVPYINHPIDVATQLVTVGGVTDPETLSAALLHDTVEDTDTTSEELEAEFGPVIAGLVAEVTDDPALSSAQRKTRQEIEAPAKSPRARMIRLADKTCNVRDIGRAPPPSWSYERRMEYYAWATRVVAGLRGANAGLERSFDEAVATARELTMTSRVSIVAD
jgi:guanosine-3',5'-bis(diphosphate) 3'-pyrophosphohydrolase